MESMNTIDSTNATHGKPPRTVSGVLCKKFRKLMERVRGRKKRCFEKQKDNDPHFPQRKGLLALPGINGNDGPEFAEKWDWDYYNCEDFGAMRWGNEWGQFEEPHRGQVYAFNRQCHKNSFLMKKNQSQATPYNLHFYSESEHRGRPCPLSPYDCKNPSDVHPYWHEGTFNNRGKNSCSSAVYVNCPQNTDSQDYPGTEYESNAGGNAASGENLFGVSEKYCELPNRFQTYTKRYNLSCENKRPLTARVGTPNICRNKGNLKTFIPLREGVNSKQGLRFKQSGKNTNWSVIDLRHEKAKSNYEKILKDLQEERRKKKLIWELRLKVGLCKRNLQQQEKTVIPKVDDLEKFYHLVYWIGHGQNECNMVGRFYDMQKNCMVALKIFSHKSPVTNVGRLENKLLALAEIKCLLEMDHPNVISLLTYFEIDEKVHLVLETCDHNLRSEISTAPKGIPESIAQGIIYQVLRGLNYCHNKKCLHRDICPENILITSDGIIKIADFDKAIFLNEVRGICPPPGTITYGSPEFLARELDCGPLEASDIWSLGIIACELLLGSPLWNCQTEKQQLEAIQIDMGFLFPRYLSHAKYNKLKEITFIKRNFSGFSDETVLFLQHCLRIDPSRRSSCQSLIDLPFMKDFHDSKPNTAMKPLNSAVLPLFVNKHDDFLNGTGHPKQIAKSSYEKHSDCENFDSDEESEMSFQKQNYHSNRHLGKNINAKLTPNNGPYFPHKVPSERLHEPNLRYNSKGMMKTNDAARHSQSQMTMKESLGKYKHGSAAGDVDLEDKHLQQRDIISEKAKSGLPTGMQGLIDSLSCATWGTVSMIKHHFDMLKISEPSSFRQNIGKFISALIQQISSTKTTVSGPSIKILSTLLKENGEYFYPDLEKLLHTLMQKIGGHNFIAEKSCEALQSLINMAPPVKLCLALTNKTETKMKNPNSRYFTSYYLHQAMSHLNIEAEFGEHNLLQKKLTSSVFRTTLWLIQDQDSRTRRCAKDILALLLKHPRFLEFYRNFVPENRLEIVHRVLKELRSTNKPLNKRRI